MMSDSAKSAIDGLQDAGADRTTYTCRNGLKLKLKSVNQMIVAEAARKLRPPVPPMVMNEAKGREEPDPTDREYRIQAQHYAFETAMLGMDIFLIMGTEVLFTPADVMPVDSDEWIEMLEATGAQLELPKTGPRRKLAWLKFYAIPEFDQRLVLNRITAITGGTFEEDVEEAAKSFRSDETRDAAIGVDPALEAGLRDLAGGAAFGISAGTGSTGSGGVYTNTVGPVGTSGFDR
jgi:hypothetical protein